jgi:2-methylcitrate dehydratase PrpD
MTVVSQLGELARSVRLDAATRASARRVTIDWFAATLAGSTMPIAQPLLESAADLAAPGACRLVPWGRRTDVRAAALINGTLSHAAELDDIYREGIYHPGSPTVAAVLALAEVLDADGAALLDAVTVGYDVGCRVAEAVNPAHYRYWHTTGTVGALGAAAGAGHLLDLTPARMSAALAVATSMAAGLQQAFRSESMSKPLHAGHAAEAGLTATLLAARDFTGAMDILEGPAGFGVAMSGDVDWAAALAPADQAYVSRMTVKSHACCGHTFAAIDAALDLRAEIGEAPIDEIVIETYEVAIRVAGNPVPSTSYEAKFSLGYCVAAALLTGGAHLSAFTPQMLDRGDLRDLLTKTRVTAVPGMTAVFPGQRHARVTVVLADGRRLVSTRTTRRGDPDDPLSDDELDAKFADCAELVLDRAQARELLDALRGLDGHVRVRGLPLPAGARDQAIADEFR